MLNRRTFLKTGLTAGAAVGPLTSALQGLSSPAQAPTSTTGGSGVEVVSLPRRLPPLDQAALPWQQKVRRVGQTNMTEYDPAVMNVDEWADYWRSAQADIVFVSVTGILAFYPSKVKFHRHGKFLNGRDLFGECTRAAKKRGMRVVARMSPDLNWGDALEAHPEWAMRRQDGSVQHSGEDPHLFKTCMFSTYMDDYVPAIMREVNSLYDVDCFYANGWPPLGSLPVCYCSICSKLPAPGTPAYWRVFTDRVLELWRKYDAIAKEKNRTAFSLPIQAATCAAARILTRLAKQPRGFRLTTRAAPMKTLRSGDAACRDVSAMPCSTARLPPTLPPLTLQEIRDGAMFRRIHLKRGCGSTKRWPAAWFHTATLLARRMGLMKTAAGGKSAQSISAGLPATTRILRRDAPSPISEW